MKKPKRPVVPNRREMTPIEGWYLECLGIISRHLKRAPSIEELAAYCKRAVNPTFEAMERLLAKGKVRRNDDRRFEVVA